MRILVVDDERLIRWSIAEALGADGDIVIEANSAVSAVRAVVTAAKPIDVILLDYNLPDVKHLDLLSTLRRLSPTSRVILMSAHATPEIAVEAVERGAARFLFKPFDMRDVPALVRGVASTRPIA